MDNELSFTWEPDPDADLSWLEEGEEVNEVWQVLVTNKPINPPCLCCGHRCGSNSVAVYASLGGVCDPDADYIRVIEAELALEAMDHRDAPPVYAYLPDGSRAKTLALTGCDRNPIT